MDTSQKMFLLAVEEMNFTKAARRAYVTQQCLSEHIRNLEKTLGTQLFFRTPRLQLTSSGKALYETLQQMSQLEANLHARINELEQGQVGEIRFGLNTTRARLFLPELMKAYHQRFPKVTLSVTLGDTEALMEDLLKQKLDLVLGVDAPPSTLLERIPAGEEALLVAATNSFLKRYYKGGRGWQDFHTGDAIDLRSFEPFPLAGNLNVSTVLKLAGSYLWQLDIVPKQIVSISDYDTQLNLSGQQLAATFCASFMLPAIQNQNQLHPQHEPLLALKLSGFSHPISIEILRPRQLFVPRYLEEFISLIQAHLVVWHEKIAQALA